MNTQPEEEGRPAAPRGEPVGERVAAIPKLTWVCLIAAFLEVGLASGVVFAGRAGLCPGGAGAGACAALIRPRVSTALGFSVPGLAVCGALLTLLCCLALRGPAWRSAALKRVAAGIPACGAGIALGLQALPWAGGLTACLLCWGLVGSALLTATLAALSAREARLALLCGGIALVFVAPLAGWRGQRLAAEDAQRRAQVATAGGERGPQLALLTRPGCGFCEAMLLDTLAEARVLALLERTRGIRMLAPESAEARPYLTLGTPTLLAFSAEGRLLSELRGYREPAQVEAWLRDLLR